MSEIAEFCDGPWDGARRAFSGLADLIWVTPNTGERPIPRLDRNPSRTSVPYSLRAAVRVGGVTTRIYGHAAAEYRVCEGCGVFHARNNADGSVVTSCSLCGESFPVHA